MASSCGRSAAAVQAPIVYVNKRSGTAALATTAANPPPVIRGALETIESVVAAVQPVQFIQHER